MKRNRYSGKLSSAAMSLILGIGLATSAIAQDQGYRIGESGVQAGQVAPTASDPGSASQDSQPVAPESSGPVRMARFSYINGSVTWRPDAQTEWAAATDNMPLREGSEVWVGDGGRAELQFDDGSYVRFGSGAVATLQTLFSDSQGEFTEIKLTDGLASMELRTDHSVYQIDTPKGAIKSVGPSRVRVGVDEDVEIGVRLGSAVLERSQGKVTLKENDYLDLQSADSVATVAALPPEDSWDKFTDERSALMMHKDPNLPENMQGVGGDLDHSGTWKDDPEYGKVWTPDQTEDWRPYQNGHWVWCEPFGWTWVGAESWGWVPYHYGSWIHRGWGWAWVPGPVNQYWSPAVVDFSCYGDDVCWSPLAPFECHYPAVFGLGVWGFGWGSYFSIGFCGVWSPFGDRYCGQRPWNNHWLNHYHDGGPGGFGAHPRLGGEVGLVASRFHPANAGFATISSTRNGFGSGGRYTALNGRAGEEAFTRGGSVGAPRGGGLVNGPVNAVRPNSSSWSGSRSLTSRPEGTGILNRNVYRGSSTPFGGSRSGGSSPAEAARQARESLGWTSSRSGGGSYSSGRGQSDWSRPFSNNTNGSGSRSTSSHSGPAKGNWSVPDHGGWSHVHSDSHSSGGGSSHSSGGGSNKGH